jgi:hypothetical protein
MKIPILRRTRKIPRKIRQQIISAKEISGGGQWTMRRKLETTV